MVTYSKDALMKIYFYIYSLRKLQNNQETTLLSYAKFKTELFVLEYSTGFSFFLIYF